MNDRINHNYLGPERRKTPEDDELIIDTIFYLLMDAAERTSVDGTRTIISRDQSHRWSNLLLGSIRRHQTNSSEIDRQAIASEMHDILASPDDVYIDPSLRSEAEKIEETLKTTVMHMPETDHEILKAMHDLTARLSENLRPRVEQALSMIDDTVKKTE